jgi:hypothetical protein
VNGGHGGSDCFLCKVVYCSCILLVRLRKFTKYQDSQSADKIRTVNLPNVDQTSLLFATPVGRVGISRESNTNSHMYKIRAITSTSEYSVVASAANMQ